MRVNLWGGSFGVGKRSLRMIRDGITRVSELPFALPITFLVLAGVEHLGTRPVGTLANS